MVDNGIVRGSAEQALPFIANGDNIYIHENITKISAENEVPEYEYQEYIYNRDEYLEVLTNQQKEISSTLAQLIQQVNNNG